MEKLQAQSRETAREIGELYAAHARRLEQIVRVDVCAPQPVIEDACQFAWSRLVFLAPHIRRETALAWLVTTAVRHACKLARREGREVSLDDVLEHSAREQIISSSAPALDELLEQRQLLAQIRLLPERQQRVIWLQVLGLSYTEIAAREHCTLRTVERQLVRAKRTMRAREAIA